MRIENLRTEDNGEHVRHAATVVWEDSERSRQEFYHETSKELGDGFYLNLNAFLTACALPAMHHGEARISVDAEVCPGRGRGTQLRDGHNAARFYEPRREPLRIETKGNGYKRIVRKQKSRAALFSSGVDSLALLWSNHLQYPKEHPWSIRNAILILGQNIESDMSEHTLEQAVIDLSAVTADAGAMLIPVYTNIWSLENDSSFFQHVNHGAIIASVTHIFARRFHTAFYRLVRQSWRNRSLQTTDLFALGLSPADR